MKKAADSKASPPVKVVGFRVEGATPSPRDTSLADAAAAASTVTGSPSPVIIPPAFGVRAEAACLHCWLSIRSARVIGPWQS